jgi:hypothetical protein
MRRAGWRQQGISADQRSARAGPRPAGNLRRHRAHAGEPPERSVGASVWMEVTVCTKDMLGAVMSCTAGLPSSTTGFAMCQPFTQAVDPSHPNLGNRPVSTAARGSDRPYGSTRPPRTMRASAI